MNAWEGTPAEGSEYTQQQLHFMKVARPHWTRFHNRPVTLRSPAANPWDPDEEVVVMCPIIAWTKDRTRVLIIAPAGDRIWMSAAPKTKKGQTL